MKWRQARIMCPCFKPQTLAVCSRGEVLVGNSINIHEILYIGDLIYSDISQSKVHLRWQTTFMCWELEAEFSDFGFKDIKVANLLVNSAGKVKLPSFVFVNLC